VLKEASPDAFRVALADALRPLSDPVKIQAEAARVLGEHLQLSCALYAEVEREAYNDYYVIKQDYCAPGARSLVGRHRARDFGTTIFDAAQAGRTLAVGSVASEPAITAAGRAAYAALGVQAYLLVPLVKEGRPVAFFAALDASPRTWTEEDLALVEETGERTWAAVERARAEAALRESEARYRSLFNTIDEAFGLCKIVTDDHGQAIDFLALEMNPAWETLTGLSLERSVGRTLKELIPSVREVWIGAGGRAALGREAVRLEGWVPAMKVWLDVRFAPFGAPGSGLFTVLAADVTARKQAEGVGRASEERQAFLLELSDALRPLADVTAVKSVACRVLGEHLGASRVLYTETDENGQIVFGPQYVSGVARLEGRTPFQTFDATLPDEIRRGRTVVRHDVAGAAHLTAEQKAAHAAARIGAWVVVPLVKEGQPVARLVVHARSARDWTTEEVALIEETAERTWAAVERALAEAELRASEARLRMALDASQMGTFVWFPQEDRGEADPRMRELFGVSRDQPRALAFALANRVHPDDRQWYAEAVSRALDPTGPGILKEEVRVVHPDGSMRWLQISGQTTFEGTPAHAARMSGMAADITDRKVTEEALRESEQRLKDIDRRKDEFLAVLAHELRNPLAPILTGLELIRRGGSTPDAVERVRTMMERQVGHMVRLIDDLLDVSRITSGKIRLQRHPTALTTLVSTAIETNRAGLGAKQLALSVELPDAPLLLDVDPTRFVQIVSNLLHNAVKFTEPAGRIRIAARVRPPSNGTEGELELSVIDSGHGISRAMLPRVFDLFVQGEGAAQGTQSGLGIGLALAQRLIGLHGGTIEARSEGPDQGSTFTIRLPLATATTRPTAVDLPPIPELRRRVVIIDDNEDAADTVAMLIETLGGEARVAYAGEAGLRLVLELRPDIVLLDIGMPGIDGYETCRRIRAALGASVVIIALTGRGLDQDKRETERAGFDAHITKPADPTILEHLLAEALPTHAPPG
jgi:PAS domain S-box-containing protein